MKVLLVHKCYNITGGADFFFREVGRVLEKNGHEVAYFSTDNDGRYEEDHKSIYWADYVDYNAGGVSRILNLPKMIYNKKNKKIFKQIIEDFKPDIVHSFGTYIIITPSFMEICKEYNIPLLMTCNDYKHICTNYKLYHHNRICKDCKGDKLYMPVVNKCCKDSMAFSIASSLEAYYHSFKNIYKGNVSTFLFSSQFMAKTTEEFWGAETFKWDILKNPYESPSIKESFEDDGYIMYFGRLIEEKGVDILIKAVKDLPQVKLKIIGDGPGLEEYKLLARGCNNIIFEGAQWGEDLNKYLSKTRFVVVPSLWHENFPYVINQSFAMGKPVVGTDKGGIPELVSDGERGYIYRSHDVENLKETILKLWNDKETVKRFGYNAKRWSDEEFNDEKFYQNIIRIYNNHL